MKQSSILLCRSVPALILLVFLVSAGPSYAACANPSGNERDIRYNNDYHTYQFCNGSNWIKFESGLETAYQATNNPTPAAGSGYFVMSGTQWNGNLGGRSGADSLCYTELTSTHTSWKGYATASSAGYLTTAHIHAFLCDASSCSNLMASTTYNFAVADNASVGGATFTTDSNGNGPNDNADWAAANYFGNAYLYWTNMQGTGSTVAWTGAANPAGACGGFTSSNPASASPNSGNSTYTNYNRWDSGAWLSCSDTYHLICFVNP